MTLNSKNPVNNLLRFCCKKMKNKFSNLISLYMETGL